jgi:hypothetical protein
MPAIYQMTARRFANLNTANAQKHLATHAKYLASHSFLKPILASKTEPEDKFVACQKALFNAWMKSKDEEAKAQIEQKKNEPISPNARYMVRIYGMIGDEPGVLESTHTRILEGGKTEQVVKPMEFFAPDFSAAQRAADRKLVEREDSLFADITNTAGKRIQTRIERRDAVARVFAKPKHPVMKGMKKSADLHWRPKSHATRSITRWNIQKG